ncbi:MFS transporter [Neofusicoccum parvum]|uniref:MFS transporter n=1 Tax=Neofusicoccum parvum TaxID=310453 RepID=A0ACB5SNB2_9PEZI|nr:MFS transporter [Neofusicoccum parvum]
MISEHAPQCFEKQTHDEKPSINPAVNNISTHDSDTRDWTAAEERAVVRKIDLTVLPLLMLLFFFLQLDRANAGNALTDGFLTDINITQAQYNTGTQLLYAGIVLLELPSNAALFRVGARFWLGGQCFAWGTVATLQAFQRDLAGFYATRALLGLCEAGFIPGALFTLSLWYTNAEISRRFACLFVANALGSACTGLVAYGVLALRGRAGLAGWQWLFILEGGLTVLASLLFVALFPKSVADPRALVGGSRFSVRERDILRRRVLLDGPSKVSERRHVSGADVFRTLKDWRVWPHLVIAVAGLAPGNALWSYMPSIISSFGYDRLQSNAMTSVGNWINVVVIIIFGILA